MEEEARRGRNWILPVAAGVVLLVLALIALFREPVTLDPDTPEGTVQSFLQAVADGEYDDALSHLSAELQSQCTAGDIARDGPYESFTATLGEVDELDGRALVYVSIREGSGSAIGSGGYTFDPGPYTLEMESGRWVISDVSWPYFYWSCEP